MTSQRIFSGFYAASAMINCMVEMPRYDKSLPNWQASAGSYDRCPDCRGWKAKKAAKCRSCTDYVDLARGRWKESPSPGAGRTRARNLYAVEFCERCGDSQYLERHHVDGDTSNNVARNIRILCRRCHMLVDGRLERLRQFHPEAKPPKPCEECGRFSTGKYLRRGLCHACNERKRRREKKQA
jgi:hypothetical protein